MSFSTRTSVARPTVWQRQLTSVISGLRLYMLLLVFSTILPSGMAASRSLVYLQHNGYKNLQVAVDESVEESEEIIARIKDSLTDASRFLYTATRKRAYFEDIRILVPKTWSDQPEYLPASTETMATADIRVDYPDIEMFQPFVYNPNPCGKQGDYMLLNPHYLMNDSMVLGPHAKVIVHEWAHLRWGVYDEYPGGKNSPRVYASKGGDFTGNRCSAAIKGRLVNLITGGKCHVIGNRPPSYCVWQDEDGGKPAGSLMYRQYLTQIDGFCDSDSSDPNYLHNKLAPNQQNKKCDKQSVWEVMRKHEDFANEANPPREIASTVPKFTLLRAKPRRTVLVLDVSASMLPFINKDGANRLLKLRQACRNYLMEIAREGEYVGIVVFNGTYGPSTEAIGTAYVLSDLVLITDDSRQHLLDAIPKEANGATSIGKGIQLGIDVLSSIDGQSISADGGNLVVVSDGEENAPPLISDIKLNVTDFGITIDSIAIGKDGSLKLEELAEATSGSMFYYPTDAPSNALNDAFMEIGKREASKRDFPAQLFSSGDLVDSNESVLKSIFIDSTVGENTQFTVTFDGNAQVATPVTLTDPHGHVYNSNSTAYEVDVDFSSIYIRVKGTATPGEYTLRVRNNQEDSVNVTVTVTSSSAVAGTRPITADSSWLYEELYPTQQQILFTTLSKGYSPILYADVFAFVDLPGNTSEEYTLTLTDDGTGADASKDDGVYSSYFTGFTANGRYSAKVVSRDRENVTVISRATAVGRGADMASVDDDPSSMEPTDRFQRYGNSGLFNLRDFTRGVEYYPPGDVTDLRITDVDITTRTVTLEWTAPGRSLDQGQASHYQLFISEDADGMIENITAQATVAPDWLVEGNLSVALIARSPERVTVSIPYEGFANQTVWFSIWTYASPDGPHSSPSNLASATLKNLGEEDKNEKSYLVPILIAAGVLVLIVVGLVCFCLNRRKLGQGDYSPPPQAV